MKKFTKDVYIHMIKDEKPIIHQGETVEEWLAKGNEINKVSPKKELLKRDKNGRYLKKE